MLIEASKKIINQIYDFSVSLGQEKFTQPIKELSGATMGQHTRHILEFFICLFDGYDTGVVNYDKRKHDKMLEGDLELTLKKLTEIQNKLQVVKLHKRMELHCNYSLEEEKPVTIQTIFERELAYNIEHAVHHMAIMKIGAAIIAPALQLTPDFGVAVSTLKHRESHVHSHFPA